MNRRKILVVLHMLCLQMGLTSSAEDEVIPPPPNSPAAPTDVQHRVLPILSDHENAGKSDQHLWQLSNTCVQVLPETQLFTPSLANPREPRIAIKRTTLNQWFSRAVLEIAVGGAAGILRLRPINALLCE